MSLDELRDAYKNSRQSRDVKLKLNGATYRKVDTNFHLTSMGNTLTKFDQIKNNKSEYLGELNDKYALKDDNLVYSLNKKKRWQLRDELVSKMKNFLEDDNDVRLYETSNRGGNLKNLTSIHTSKGDAVTVKNTYANLNSVKKKFELDEISKRNPKTEEIVIKKVRSKKCSKPKKLASKVEQQETIVIDLDQEENDFSFAQYEIEYAPRKDLLKYGSKKFVLKKNSQQTKKVFEKLLSISDDETLRRKINEGSSEDEYLQAYEADNLDDYESNYKITLDELINKFTYTILNKRKMNSNQNLLQNEIELKDRKIYIDKSECVPKSPLKKQSKNASKKPIRVAESVFINLMLTNSSIDSKTLALTYGNLYSEAFNCWPRNYSINISKEVEKSILSQNCLQKDLDLVVWLIFQEDPLQTDNNAEFTRFNVSFCSNLECDSIGLENINVFFLWDLNDVHDKAVQFISKLPLDVFKLKEKTKLYGNIVKPSNVCDSIPITGGKRITHSIDDLKLEILKSSKKYDRTNSIEVTKTEEWVDVVKQERVEQDLSQIFKNKSYECKLCFDEKFDLNDCVLMKNCAHCICYSCMKDYVDSKLDNPLISSGELQCPACDEPLELALMINFASNGNQMDNFIRMRVENVYFVLSNYKWCPSPGCSKILQIDLNSNPFGTVSCTCGFKFCLKCNNQPHFPAKCNQISNYYNDLKINNDLHEPQDQCYTTTGQRCPKCNTFMEKNGGCNHMTCSLCTTQFCWNCLSLWQEHATNSNGICTKPKVQVKVEFKKERKIKKSNKSGSRYEDSLLHRQKRSINEKKLKIKNMKRLIKTIKFDDDQEEYLTNNENVSKTEKIVEIGKIHNEKRRELQKFLDEMVLFINELHFICEHSYVLLCDNSLDKEKKNSVSNIVKSIEVVLWRIENNLSYGKGIEAIDELKEMFSKGLKCIQTLKNTGI